MPTLLRTAPGRRQFLKGLALSSLGLATIPARPVSAATPASALDLESPTGLLSASIRMRGSLDERLAFIWLRGIRYALSNGEAAPLCGYVGGAITRYRQLSDDAFEFLLYEISYYTDLDTGEVLNTVRMPFTGREVEVPLYRTGPGRHVVMLFNEEELDWSSASTTSEELARQIAPDAKVHYRFNLRPAVEFGDQVWIRSDSFTRLVPVDAREATMFYKEAITYQARRDDLANPATPQVASNMSFAIATAWRPWMQMQGVNGHTVADGIGGKVLAIGDMPEDFLRFSEVHNPDVLDDPAALLKI